MPFPGSAKQPYFDALLQAYEAEVAGETYFKTLTGVFSEPDQHEKLMLLADVEQRTWITLRPLIKRHRLEPLDSAVLAARGKTWVIERAFQRWKDLMDNMTTRYPGFIEEFKALEAVGPDEDKCALKVLVRHEVALLAFAEREVAGDASSLALVRAFLADFQFSTPGEFAP
jgi:hypothetical protein